MLGKRRFFRVKGSFAVHWKIEDKAIAGDGIVSNISITGMEMVINKVLSLSVGTIFCIEAAPGEVLPLQSKKAKVMRSEKIIFNGVERLRCGLEFVK